MAKIVSTYTVPSRGIGTPDYSTPKPVGQVPIGPVYTLTDLAELAARLGSIDTFDRRGNVLWLDDFEDGIKKWIVTLTGGRGSVVWDAEHPHHGGFSALLTTGNVTGDMTRVSRDFPVPVVSRLGCELSCTRDEYIDNIHLELLLYDGTYKHDVDIKWIEADERWQYYGSDGLWHDLEPTMFLPSANFIFNTIKVVADFTTGYLARLIANSTLYDLSSYQYRKTGSLLEPRLEIEFDITTKLDGEAAAHLGSVIITQNEP